MGKRLLFISSLYPNPLSPTMASYNRQQITALREYCEVEVISPIPWISLLKHNLKQPSREESGMTIHYPIYYYSPCIFRERYGDFFYYSIKHVSTRLLNKKKFDIIFSSWLYPDSWAAAKLAKLYNLPLFVKVHGTDVNRLTVGSAITRKSLHVANQAEKVICVSKALKDRLIALGVSEFKLEVLYNGVDRTIFYPMDREYARQQLKLDTNEFVVLYVGNLKKEKGLYELIASFRAASAAISEKSRLIIIGSGAYRRTANQLVSSLHLSKKVHFLGDQPLETVAQWMNAASLLCLPSYMEGVPNVVLEAFSCGTKVIATSVGGIPELDARQGNIRLIDPRSVSQLTQALSDMRSEKYLYVESNFINTWHENAARIFQIFQKTGGS